MKRGLGRLLGKVRDEGGKEEKKDRGRDREKREVSYALASFLFEFRGLI